MTIEDRITALINWVYNRCTKLPEDTFVEEHAFRHGLTEEEILHAWAHRVAWQHRSAPHEQQIVAIGCDGAGRLVQMVAIEKDFGVLIYHALMPPTRKVLSELGLEGECGYDQR